MKKVPILMGAVLAAIAASSCCILPLLLGAASAGAVGLGAVLAPYRPYLMSLTAVLLGAAFYFTYRPEKAACGTDGSCTTPRAQGVKRLSRGMLWLVTLFTVGAMAFPEIAEHRASVKAASAPKKASAAVFTVGNITCAACSLQIVDALKKTPGVYDARVEYKIKRVEIDYDTTRIDVSRLQAAIVRLGYPAKEVSAESL